MPLVGALAGFVALLPSMIFGNDLGAFLSTIGLLICIGFILLVAAGLTVRRQAISALDMLAVFCVVAWLLFKVSYNIYEAGRWFVHRGEYKAEVLKAPNPVADELRHMDWDGWGFAGAGDTTVYLVFDPTNRLAKKYEGDAGPPPGVPCKVWRIHRLEQDWYTVTFFTDTHWDQCEYL
jgi:hypothetical protein